MPRDIKEITNDLIPLSDAVRELSSLVSQLLSAIKPHTTFDDPKAEKFFHDSIEASTRLSVSAEIIRDYAQEILDEANPQGIT